MVLYYKYININKIKKCKSIEVFNKYKNQNDIILINIENLDVSRLNTLGNLINLTKLSITACNYTTNITLSLNGFINLKELSLDSNKNLKELNIIDSCFNLEKLSIIFNHKLENISNLDTCIKLEKLYIRNNYNLSQLPNIDKCINLKIIRIEFCNKTLSSLPRLDSCIKLQKLVVVGNKNLTSLPSLESCINLEELRITHNTNLTYIPSLKSCINLEELYINNNNYNLLTLPRGIVYLKKLKYYKKINNNDDKYPENENIPELIHYIIREHYYYLPIIQYYRTQYLE